MQTAPTPVARAATTSSQAWRLQDAKSQFSALVDNALRGVPQHVTRRGKQAVVVLSEHDFEALQRGAGNRAARPASFVAHLLAMPTQPIAGAGRVADKRHPSLDLQPREMDWA